MAWWFTTFPAYAPMGAPSGTVNRFFRWGGIAAGGDVDGVRYGTSTGWASSAGNAAQVEAGESISADSLIATDSVGRAVVAGAGDTVVGRALSGASGAGDTVVVIFASGR